MSFLRVIPTLLLKGQGLVKTTKFKNPNYIGDPINAVKIFNEKEVDELVLLDIEATVQKRDPNYKWIKDIVSESFMPMGYGGGIHNITQIKTLFDLGIEKVILNTASQNFSLIEEAAKIYGNQSIVGCIDVKKNVFGKNMVCFKAGSDKKKISPTNWAEQLEKAGCGELIIQSIDKEGTMSGYDIPLIKSVTDSVKIPVVASGGAGSLDDLKEGLIEGGASAVTAGSLFVYKGKQKGILINYPKREDLDSIIKN